MSFLKTETFSRIVICLVLSRSICFWERLRRAVCPKWTPNQIRVGRFQGKCFLFECIPTKFQSLRGRLDKWSTTYVINLSVVFFCSRWLLFLPNSGSSLWFRSDQVPFFFWKVGWLRRIFLFYLLCTLPLLKRSMRLWITYLKTENFSGNVVCAFSEKELRLAAPWYWTPNQTTVDRLQGPCLLFDYLPTHFLSLHGSLHNWYTNYTNNLFGFVAGYCIWCDKVELFFGFLQINFRSFKSWVVLTNLSVLIAVFLVSSETVDAFLDTFFLKRRLFFDL